MCCQTLRNFNCVQMHVKYFFICLYSFCKSCFFIDWIAFHAWICISRFNFIYQFKKRSAIYLGDHAVNATRLQFFLESDKHILYKCKQIFNFLNKFLVSPPSIFYSTQHNVMWEPLIWRPYVKLNFNKGKNRYLTATLKRF